MGSGEVAGIGNFAFPLLKISWPSGYAPLLFRASSASQKRPVNLSDMSRHIVKMAKMRPDEVLLQHLPSSMSVGIYPSTSGPSSPTSLCEDRCLYPPFHASDEQRTLKVYVSILSEKLRMYYPKRIEWPDEQPPPYVSWNDLAICRPDITPCSKPRHYIDVLVSPVVQLRAPFITEHLYSSRLAKLKKVM
jgi:hypothetical protein